MIAQEKLLPNYAFSKRMSARSLAVIAAHVIIFYAEMMMTG